MTLKQPTLPISLGQASLGSSVYEPSYIVDLIHRLTSGDPRVRSNAADGVTDHPRSLSAFQADLLARTLAIARLAEPDAWAQESQLSALLELSNFHDTPAAVIQQLREGLSLTAIPPAQVEYLEELFELFAFLDRNVDPQVE